MYLFEEEIEKYESGESEITLKDYLGQLSEKERMYYEAYDIVNVVKDLQKANIDNIESYIDDIVKWNMVNRLFLRGFNILDNLFK